MTLSPAASFSAAAAITSMTMNGSTAPARRDTGRDMAASAIRSEGSQSATGRIDRGLAGIALAFAVGTGNCTHEAALAGPCGKRGTEPLVVTQSGTCDR